MLQGDAGAEIWQAVRERLGARRPALVSGTLLTAVFWLFGGLSGAVAAVGLLALLAGAAIWPTAEHEPSVMPKPKAEADQSLATSLPWIQVLAGIPAAALVLDGEGVVIAANILAAETLGIRSGRHLSLTLRSPDLSVAIDAVRRDSRAGQAELRLTVPFERALTAHITPLGEQGTSSALLVVFRDRTEEQQLNQLRADFVANASHELRTPLASVKGFIETLRGAAKEDPAARERFLAIMQEQADRMSRLIDDLLSLSRIEMREHVPPRETVDLGAVTQAAARALGPLAEGAGQILAVTISEGLPAVTGDRDELTQVVQNLVQNAIKYGRRGGHVRVTVAHQGPRIALSVADDGIGIAPQHVPRLTERFYRVSAKDSRERGGTGLGLAIVKHIVNRHRGELTIASELGRGSTFTVLLPVAGDQSR